MAAKNTSSKIKGGGGSTVEGGERGGASFYKTNFKQITVRKT